MSSYMVYISVIVILMATMVFATHDAAAEDALETRTIGLLVPYTGVGAPVLAEQVHDAVYLALEYFNHDLMERDAGWQLAIEHRDTHSDPVQALKSLEDLDALGIKAVIGPAISSSLREVVNYVDANEMLAISYSSGAADLAIVGDRIFRTTSDAKTQTAANYRLMYDNDIREVITIFLDDVVGQSVNQTTYDTVNANTTDGMVMRGSIKFASNIDDVSVITSELKAILAADPPITDHSQVAIIIFDYTYNILDIIQNVSDASIPGINQTKWYGSGHRMSELAANPITKSFLTQTNYKAIVPAHTENAINIRINSLVNGAGIYAYAAYDALFTLGNAIDIVGNATDVDAIADTVQEAALIGHGYDQGSHISNPLTMSSPHLHEHPTALGFSLLLNEAGDLAGMDYHIYAIDGDDFEATHRYDLAMDEIHEFSKPDKMKVGVLVSETGDLAEGLGIVASKAISLAEYNYNMKLATEGVDWRVETVRMDDATYPPLALTNIQSMHADGIRAVVGPLTSGAVEEILDYVNTNNMVAISYGSSSPTLALQDNMFRMRADDSHLTAVFVKALEHDNIRDLIIIYRNDTWGRSLNDLILDGAMKIDGDITIHPSIRYEPSTSGGPSIDSHGVVDRLTTHLAGVDMSSAAVMIFGFTEMWEIVDIARTHPDLQEGRWFGDLSSADIQISPERVQWLEKVRYGGATTLLMDSPVSVHIDLNIPDANIYSYHAYDTFNTLADAIMIAGTSDADDIGEAIPLAAANLWPTAIGFQLELNEAGDLDGADYNLYEFCDGRFSLRGTYDDTTDTLNLVEGDCVGTHKHNMCISKTN